MGGENGVVSSWRRTVVVLYGAATVTSEDGTAAMELKPGDSARLRAGQRMVWTVGETLRKVYLALR